MRKLFLFLLVILMVLFVPVSAVRLEFAGSVCYYPIGANSTLEVRYTHSVSLTSVVDVYRVSSGGMYFVREMWQEFLAGQPIDFDYRNGSFYVKNANEYLGHSWEYWFIPVNNATITVGGKIIFHQPKEESVLKIETGRIPLIELIIWRCS